MPLKKEHFFAASLTTNTFCVTFLRIFLIHLFINIFSSSSLKGTFFVDFYFFRCFIDSLFRDRVCSGHIDFQCWRA